MGIQSLEPRSPYGMRQRERANGGGGMEIQQAIEQINAIDSQITEAIDLMTTIIRETLNAVEEILS